MTFHMLFNELISIGFALAFCQKISINIDKSRRVFPLKKIKMVVIG